MADAPYLIVLALLEQGGERAMPLQGKSLQGPLQGPLQAGADPGEVGRQQALDLLVRVWQRSDQGALRRAAAEQSLLLVTVPIESLQEQLPALKAQWLSDGDTPALIAALKDLGSGLWSLTMDHRQPLAYQTLG